MSTPVPDLKPHVLPPPGTTACGCCDGIAEATPQGIHNRGGLSAIGYRIGEYGQFRDSLHALLSSSRFPRLANLRTRDADDFTIALIDGFACAADVLTFYQERIANESYLRTAREQLSLRELGKLIGYRLRPGVAAETWLAFALETKPAPPPTLAPEPGNFVTGVPDTLVLAIGLQVKSVPGPGEQPQTFETVEALAEARPAWNAGRPWLAQRQRPATGDTDTWIEGVANNVKAGDALVILGDDYLSGTDDDKWAFRIVDSVELEPAANRTRIRWRRPLGAIGPTASAQLHVLRKRAAAFGHNAPLWLGMSKEFRENYPDNGAPDHPATEWPHFTLSPAGATTDGGFVDLDLPYPEVRNGSWAVLAKGTFNFAQLPVPAGTQISLFAVDSVADIARAGFALAGKVTRLELRGPEYADFASLVRETVVFAQSEALTFADYPVAMPIGGDRIPVAIGADGLLPGRKLIVIGTSTAGDAPIAAHVTLVAAHPVDANRTELEITPALAQPLRRDSVVVHANVAAASHGESVAQVLGSGNASVAFQRFELKQLPLTYRAAANELGAAAQLTVRVGDVGWQQLPSLYGAAPTARAYALSTDELGREYVVFGDGLRGARLPTGANNVRASYRKGLGAAGNVGADTLTQLMSRPLGLKSVANPRPAEGGTDPEPREDARRSMPLFTRTLGRAVSVLDYEDYARAYSGVAKAQARVLDLAGGRTVVITVARPAGASLTPGSALWLQLLAALKNAGDPHVPVQLLSAQLSTFHIGLRYQREPAFEAGAVRAALEAALRERFAFDARAPGQPVQQSEVIAAAHEVPGIVAVELTLLYGGTKPLAQTVPSKQLRLLASRMRVHNGIARPAEILTLDPAPFAELEELP